MLGKTKCGTRADVYPLPNNPYDAARTPGASSSGDAAAVASGLSTIGIGSDSGGSLRFPAHCCGVATLKPTNGRVPSKVERHLFEWDRLRRAFYRFMNDYDLTVCPAAPWPAPRHGEERIDDYIYTLPFSLTGYPAAVVRCSTSPEGLPIGVQIVASPWRDHVAIAAACVVEAASGGWQKPRPI